MIRALACLAFGCIVMAVCGGEPSYSTPGTLYVEFWSAQKPPDRAPNETTLIRAGRVAGSEPIAYAVARDRPDRSFAAHDTSACDRYSYKLSPDGLMALCVSPRAGRLRLFEVASPNTGTAIASQFENNADDSSFAWLSNDRFAALMLDKACPHSRLYDFFPTRVVLFDRSGRRLSAGPCAFGIVAGGNRVALLGELPNGLVWRIREWLADDSRYFNDGYDVAHHAWSVDGGRTWHDGEPLAFDGNDRLLYATAFGRDVRSEGGQIAFRNVARIQWSR